MGNCKGYVAFGPAGDSLFCFLCGEETMQAMIIHHPPHGRAQLVPTHTPTCASCGEHHGLLVYCEKCAGAQMNTLTTLDPIIRITPEVVRCWAILPAKLTINLSALRRAQGDIDARVRGK